MRFLCAGLFFAAVSSFGQTATPPMQTTSLPPVGLTSTETLQVNVFNAGPVAVTGVAAPCTGSVAFYDASGNIIGSATDFKVSGGQIFSATLPYSAAQSAGTSRIVIRAQISITAGGVAVSGAAAPAVFPSCLVASSLETYDTSTGVTHAFLAAPGPQVVSSSRSGVITLPAPAR